MDFRLTEEQTLLSDTVAAMLTEHCASARLRAQLDRGEALDATRWAAIVELGLPRVMAPESAGGAGLGALDMVLVAVACGAAALPEPLVEHAGVAVPMLADARSDFLKQAASGAIVAIGHAINPYVANADSASMLLLPDGGDVHLVARESVKLTRVESFDPFRRLFKVTWKPSASTLLISGPRARDLCDEALERGALFAAAQALGVAQRAIDLAVAYARERKQFGKPIGSFQAIKHHLATAQTKIEFARPVLYAAAAELDAMSSNASTRISHAKLACSAAADAATHAALQVHGAMGFSWETDVHFLLKRSLALTNAWGTPAMHKQRVMAHMLSQRLGPDATFPALAEPEAALEPA